MAEIDSSTIATNAAKPKEVAGDQGRVQMHPIPDQIMADKYNRAQAANSRSTPPWRLTKIKPGGAI